MIKGTDQHRMKSVLKPKLNVATNEQFLRPIQHFIMARRVPSA